MNTLDSLSNMIVMYDLTKVETQHRINSDLNGIFNNIIKGYSKNQMVSDIKQEIQRS